MNAKWQKQLNWSVIYTLYTQGVKNISNSPRMNCLGYSKNLQITLECPYSGWPLNQKKLFGISAVYI